MTAFRIIPHHQTLSPRNLCGMLSVLGKIEPLILDEHQYHSYILYIGKAFEEQPVLRSCVSVLQVYMRGMYICMYICDIYAYIHSRAQGPRDDVHASPFARVAQDKWAVNMSSGMILVG